MSHMSVSDSFALVGSQGGKNLQRRPRRTCNKNIVNLYGNLSEIYKGIQYTYRIPSGSRPGPSQGPCFLCIFRTKEVDCPFSFPSKKVDDPLSSATKKVDNPLSSQGRRWVIQFLCGWRQLTIHFLAHGRKWIVHTWFVVNVDDPLSFVSKKVDIPLSSATKKVDNPLSSATKKVDDPLSSKKCTRCKKIKKYKKVDSELMHIYSK